MLLLGLASAPGPEDGGEREEQQGAEDRAHRGARVGGERSAASGAATASAASDECDLATRYPGFWLHVVANFAYVLVAVALLLVLGLVVAELRAARAVA